MHPGALSHLEAELAALDVGNVLLIHGEKSWVHASSRVLAQLRPTKTEEFCVTGPLPNMVEVAQGVVQLRGLLELPGRTAVVAVGGGRVLDTGKLVSIFAAETGQLKERLQGGQWAPAVAPIVAIPTTAGSGSEVTPFAVVYEEGRKYSVTHPSLSPRIALVDAELSASLPPYITACTGLDALCQAFESLWAVGSSSRSRQLALGAAKKAWNHLPGAVNCPTLNARAAMAEAATQAGRAIATSKTTVCHALSYGMTMRWGIPHGHAVALTFGASLVHNASTDAGLPSKGVREDALQVRIGKVLDVMGVPNAREGAKRFSEFVSSLGVSTRLSELGIRGASDRQWLIDQVNTERLANNPRCVSLEALGQILESIA